MPLEVEHRIHHLKLVKVAHALQRYIFYYFCLQ